MPAVVEAASEQTRIGLVLADAEFDSERNHTYIRQQLGAQSMIPAKRGKKTGACATCVPRCDERFHDGSTGADRSCVNEQDLFTRALSLAEKRGKSIHLAVAPATEKWEGILRAAQSLQSSTIALGLSSWRAVTDEASMAGLAWEALPEPRPHLTLEIYSPTGQEHVFYLGPPRRPRD